MSRLFFAPFSLILGLAGSSFAAPILTCNEAAVAPVVRGEGITERAGDLVFDCSGGPANGTISGNLSIFLNVNVTNRASNGVVSGVVLSVDTGSGPQILNINPILGSPSNLIFNGLSFALSSSGEATLRIANIRVAANQLNLAPNTPIQAFIAFNSSLVVFDRTQFDLAQPVRGLYAGSSTNLICATDGSPLPDNIASFAAFLSSKAAFASTRLTEGFADAFNSLKDPQGLNADTGTRFLITYSGLPAGAQLFVPNVVAGSDAITPTSAGDLGIPASGGKYAPGGVGSLLLVRVDGADANGAGGTLVYTPGPPGSGTVSFDAMGQLTVDNGVGYAVYEVVDDNPNLQESAQFPTYLGLAPFSGQAVVTTETVSLAPISTVTTATAKDPIPRFQAVPPPDDCNIIGDCNATYYPKLVVNTTPLNFVAQVGGGNQVAYVQVNNRGGGHMVWAATVSYTNGSDWIKLDPSSDIDNATIFVEVMPGNLAVGTYQAVITVNAGPHGGSMDVPVTLVVNPAAGPPPPTVTNVINAATYAPAPAVPGSILSLIGKQLGGKDVKVSFDGFAGQVLYDGATQINVVVPSALANKTATQLVVTIDGSESVAQTLNVSSSDPGIFQGGVLNQDYKVNGSGRPAKPQSFLQIFATGMSGSGAITAKINDTVIDPPAYGGVAPGLSGVQQVNVQLPAGLSGTTANVKVCIGPAGAPDQAQCSPAVPVVISQ